MFSLFFFYFLMTFSPNNYPQKHNLRQGSKCGELVSHVLFPWLFMFIYISLFWFLIFAASTTAKSTLIPPTMTTTTTKTTSPAVYTTKAIKKTTTSIKTTTPSDKEEHNNRSRIIMIVVIVLCIVGLAIIGILVIFLCCRRKVKRSRPPLPHPHGTENSGYTPTENGFSNGIVSAGYSNGAVSLAPAPNHIYDTIDEKPTQGLPPPVYTEKLTANGGGALVGPVVEVATGGVDADGYEKLKNESRPESVATHYETMD